MDRFWLGGWVLFSLVFSSASFGATVAPVEEVSECPIATPDIPVELTIQGQIVDLRPENRADYPYFFSFFNSPEVNRFVPELHDKKGWTIEAIESRHERNVELQRAKSAVSWVIRHKATRSVAGEVRLYDLNFEAGTAEMTIYVAPSFWRKGVSADAIKIALTYAFETLKLKKVRFGMTRQNTRMQQLLSDLGIRYVGLFVRRNLETFIPWEDYEATDALWPKIKDRLQERIDRAVAETPAK